MVIDQTGALSAVKRHDYLPFGEEIGTSVGGRTTAQGYMGDNIRQRWAQLERDGETGLDFAQARYYSATMGRFTSVDPENAGAEPENPQTWNGYTYALNNPIVLVDPDGLKVVLYDKDHKKVGEIEDSEANAGLFNRDWQRQNGHRVERGVIYDRDDNVIGYYENTCCDWLAGSWKEGVVHQLQKPETWVRAVPGAVLNVVIGTRGGGGGLPNGLRKASKGLKELFSGGSLRNQPIMNIRNTLRSNGFTQTLTKNKSGYLFRNAAGEEVRVMRRGGAGM